MGGTKSIDMTVAQLNILSPDLSVNPLEYYEKCIGKYNDIDEAINNKFLPDCPYTYKLITKFVVIYSDFILNPRTSDRIYKIPIDRSHKSFSQIRDQDNFLSMLGLSDSSIKLIKRDLVKYHNIEYMNKTDQENRKSDQLITPSSINTIIDYINIFMKHDENHKYMFSNPKDNPRNTRFSSKEAIDPMCFSSLDKRKGVKIFYENHFDKNNLIKFFELDNSLDIDNSLDKDRDSKVNRVLHYDYTFQSNNAPLLDYSLIYNILDLFKRKIIYLFIFLLTTNDSQSMKFRERLSTFKFSTLHETNRDMTVEFVHKFLMDEEIADIIYNLMNEKEKTKINLLEIYDKDASEDNLKLKRVYKDYIENLNKEYKYVTNIEAKYDFLIKKLPDLDLFIINEVTSELYAKIKQFADEFNYKIFPDLKTKNTKLKIEFDEDIKIKEFITILIVNENHNYTMIRDSGRLIQYANNEMNYYTISSIPENTNDILRNTKVKVKHKNSELSIDVYCLHLPSDEYKNDLRREYVNFILKEYGYEENPDKNKKFLISGDMNEEFFGDKVNPNTKECIDSIMDYVMGDDSESYHQILRREFKDEKTTSKCRTGMQSQINKIAIHDEKFKDIIIGNATYKLHDDYWSTNKLWKNEIVDISDHKYLQMILQW